MLYKLHLLLRYFVVEHNYIITSFNEANKNILNDQTIWLLNNNKKKYQIIRISLDDKQVDIIRDLVIVKELAKQLKIFKPSFLSITISNNSYSMHNSNSDYIMLDTNHFIGDNKILKHFKGLNSIIYDINDNADKEALSFKIAKEINDLGAPKLKEASIMKTFLYKYFSNNMITKCLLIICALLFLILHMLPFSTSINSILLGANYKTLIIINHEYLRLFTANFIHYDPFHLMMNLFSLYYLGLYLEESLGTKNYLALIIGGGILGNISQMLLGYNSIVVGISASIYALFAIIIIYAIKNQAILRSPLLIYSIIINILLNFSPNVSYLGHLGGFIFGLVYYFIFISPLKFNKAFRINFAISFIMICVIMLANFFIDQKMEPHYLAFDNAIIKTYEKLGFKGHAERLEKRLYNYYWSKYE